MKTRKTFCIIVISFLTMYSCNDKSHNEELTPKMNISQEEALNIVEEHFINTDYSVFISSRTLNSNTMFFCFDTIYSPKGDSWFIFIDKIPSANWAPYQAIFIDSNTGKYDIKDENFPPNIPNLVIKKHTEPGISISDKDYYVIRSFGIKTSYNPKNDDKRAIIISGGGNMHSNYERYWNDYSAIFST